MITPAPISQVPSFTDAQGEAARMIRKRPQLMVSRRWFKLALRRSWRWSVRPPLG